jgi:hypothetical protein
MVTMHLVQTICNMFLNERLRKCNMLRCACVHSVAVAACAHQYNLQIMNTACRAGMHIAL